MKSVGVSTIYQLLISLEEAKINYELKRIRNDSIMAFVSVPGQRWEIEYMDDGSIEIEIFKSDGKIQGAEMLDTLFREFSD